MPAPLSEARTPAVAPPRRKKGSGGGGYKFRFDPDGSLVLDAPDATVRWSPESSAKIARWMFSTTNAIRNKQRSGALVEMVLPAFRHGLKVAFDARSAKSPDAKTEKRLATLYWEYPEIVRHLTKQEHGRWARLRAKIQKEARHARTTD